MSIHSDKDATVIFGCYDATAAAFFGVYPVTLLAAGANTFHQRFNTGFPLPLGGDVHPAIQVVVAASAILTGHIETLTNVADRDTDAFSPAQMNPFLI